MGNRLILFATAASFLLGACGSNVEEPADTPISAVEESAGTPISAAELADRIEAGSAPLILDVRSRKEYAEGHIPGAINIPYNELATRLAELPIAKSEEVAVYGKRGQRAAEAEKTLSESGYSNVRDITGRWQGAWISTE